MARGHATRRPNLTPDVQIEGRHPVMEALRAGRPLRKLVVARGSAAGSLQPLIGEAHRRGIPVQEVEKAVVDRLAPTRAPQGVIAYAAAHRVVDIDDLLSLAQARGEGPLVLLLHGVEDPGDP